MAEFDNNSMQNEPSGGGGTGRTIAIVVAVLLLIVAVRWYKSRGADASVTPSGNTAMTSTSTEGPTGVTTSNPSAKLPRLVDLGATKCEACKKLAPILEDLKKQYAGRLDVQFIDVWQNPKAGDVYGIRLIPTQIFFDASGKERFRHEGFMSKEDILGKWKEFGVDLSSS